MIFKYGVVILCLTHKKRGIKMSLIKIFNIDIEKTKKRIEKRRQEELELRWKLKEEKENQKIIDLGK